MPIDDGRQKLKWKSWQIDLANGCIKEEWGTQVHFEKISFGDNLLTIITFDYDYGNNISVK